MIKIFCERLRKLRTDSNMSQAKLAIALRTNQQAIDRWERGLNEPAMETITQIAVIFDVSADYLLGLSNEFGSVRVNNSFNGSTVNGGIQIGGSGNKIDNSKKSR